MVTHNGIGSFKLQWPTTTYQLFIFLLSWSIYVQVIAANLSEIGSTLHMNFVSP